RLVVSLLAARLLPGRAAAGRVPVLLRVPLRHGGAELDRLPAPERRPVPPLGRGRPGRVRVRRQALADPARPRDDVPRAGAVARRPPRPRPRRLRGAPRRRDALVRRRLRPRRGPRRLGPPARVLGGRRRDRPRRRPGCRAVPLPPPPRAALLRRRARRGRGRDPRPGVRLRPPRGRADRAGDRRPAGRRPQNRVTAVPVECDSHTWPYAGRAMIGPPAAASRRTTRIDAGSTTSTRPASMHGTHSSPSTTADPSGFRSTRARPVTCSVRASSRATTFVSCDTYSEPPSPVIQSAPASGTEATTRFAAGSMRTTRPP